MSDTPLGARKDAHWYAMCIEPSITKTPIGPVQVPVPYQVISDLSQAMGTSDTVFFNGQPAYLLDQSKMMNCTGDEQGSSGGSRSGTTSLEVKPTRGSGSVKINGKAIVRMGDLCTLNKENCKGRYIVEATPMAVHNLQPCVQVRIIPSQTSLCPDAPIELTAVGTPPGGTYTWRCEGPCQLVDATGNPKTEGARIYAKLDIEKDADATIECVHVTVRYTSNGQSKEASRSLRIHPPVPLWITWGIWIGKISSIVDGDELGAKDDKEVLHRDPTNLFDFKEQPYALVVIPGMNMKYDEAVNMQRACNYTFKVHSSALIQNYTHGFALSGDIVQSIYSEALGAIDRNAVATANAILKGVRERSEVYVIAHSQGSEVFAKALKILTSQLTPAELGKIHYQGFGSETYIHNDLGLGSARNARAKGDPIPGTGSTAKLILATIDVQKADGAPTLDVMKALYSAGQEDWELVDSPLKIAHYFPCRHSAHMHPVPDVDRHNFLLNYWMHVRIPSTGVGAPNYEPARFEKYPKQIKKIDEWSGDKSRNNAKKGVSILGQKNTSKYAPYAQDMINSGA